jgi:preprotein translocase subunit SecD
MGIRRGQLIAIVICALAVCVVAALAATLAVNHAMSSNRSATMRLIMHAPGGGTPSGPDADRTAAILVARFKAAGVGDVKAERSGDRLELKFPAEESNDRLRSLITRGDVQFRLVLGDTPARWTPGSTPAVATQGSGPKATLDAVKAKLGAAYDLAAKAEKPEDMMLPDNSVLQPFDALTPAEVAVLPPTMQFVVPNVDCPKLAARPGPAADADVAVGCDEDSKYLMDKARVGNGDVRSAEAVLDKQSATWTVTVSFTPDGQQRWTDLTKDAYNGGVDKKRVAIVVDGSVVSAPSIESVIPGDASIAGRFTSVECHDLAAKLTGGRLPVDLTVESIS